MKRKSPWHYLLEEFQDYVNAVRYRHQKMMFRYKKPDCDKTWRLDDLYQRVQAAEQLGYDVELRATNEYLEVWYIKKLPYLPSRFQR